MKELLHSRDIRRILDVDVGNLVIRYREGTALPGIKVFPAKIYLEAEITGRPQDSIRMDGPLHLRHSIFGENDNPASPVPKKIDQPPAKVIDFRQVLSNITIRAHLLKDVIEMG